MKAKNLKERIYGAGLILVLLTTAFSLHPENLYLVNKANSTDSATVKFLRDALVCNRMEIQLALMASKRAVRQEVNAYAKNMLHYQKDLNLKLKGIAAEKNVQAKDELDARCKDVIDKLSRLNGTLYERKYFVAAERNQKETILVYQQLIENSPDPEVKAFATATIPFLETHNASIQLLSKSLK